MDIGSSSRRRTRNSVTRPFTATSGRTRYHLGPRPAAAAVLWLACLVGAGDCNGGPKPPVYPEPASIDVVPAALTVVRDPLTSMVSFELEARLTDATGTLIPTAFNYQPVWSTTADPTWLSLTPQTDHRVRVDVKSTAPDILWQAHVYASIDGAVDDGEAIIQISPTSAGISGDRIERPHTSGTPASVALVEGAGRDGATVECVDDAVVSFVRVGVAGDMVGSCSAGERVVVFSPDKGAAFEDPAGWTPDAINPDVVSVSSSKDPLRPVKVAIWASVGVDELDGEQPADVWSWAVNADVPSVNAILHANRAGLEIEYHVGADFDFDGTVPADKRAIIGTGCKDAHAMDLAELPDHFITGIPNVYYVNAVFGDPLFRGWFCRREDGERVIYVRWSEHAAATLAHELAHALGLLWPLKGHPYNSGFCPDRCIAGFDSRNLMAGSLSDDAATVREHLSLGQVFRMNADAFSATPSPVAQIDCQCDPYTSTPCPRLAEDLWPPPTGGGQIPSWQCADHILLTDVDESHLPAVGIVRGRLFRSTVDDCVDDIAGGSRSLGGLVALTFPNLTAPMACGDLEVFAFFDGKAPAAWTLPVQYPELDHERNTLNLSGGVSERLAVPVYLWYYAAKAPVDEDTAAANDVFGRKDDPGKHRTGMWLDFRDGEVQTGWTDADFKNLLESVVDWPPFCTIPSQAFMVPEAINVYYVSSMDLSLFDMGYDDGFHCRASDETRLIVLYPAGDPSYSEDALAHHIGHALSLDDVSGGAVGDPANVMAQIVGGRTGLTLGQVFRLHYNVDSWLNQSPLSPRAVTDVRSCDPPGSDPCPTVAAKSP